MNILIDRLPTSVEIDGATYQVNWCCRTFIQFEMIMQSDICDKEKLVKGLELFYRNSIPINIEQAIDKLVWFYRCGETEQKSVSNAESTQTYSFEHDSAYIYSTFKDQYGVDLVEDTIHWWKFRSMFLSLKDNNKISEIIGYRSVKIEKDMSKSQKEFYKKMKRKYRIPISKEKSIHTKSIVDALNNGKSLEEIK